MTTSARTPAAPAGSLMAFDTASMYFRAFYGVPATMRAPDGTPVNAVRGLLDMIARLVEQYQPTELSCAWDSDWRPQWRVELVESYKAHRVTGPADEALPLAAGGRGAHDAEEAPADLVTQVGIIESVLEALNIPVVGVADHEADDVLGTLATTYPGTTLVVTGDRDLFQLASTHTSVLYVGRGVAAHEIADPSWVIEHYGVTPEQYVDFAVLRGDPSDGLPGVRGIGDKTAAALIARYGDLAGIATAASTPARVPPDKSEMTPRIRAAIVDAVDYLAAAQQVVSVVRDLDLGERAWASPQPDLQRCAELQETWGLSTSMTRVLDALASARESMTG